MIFSFNQTDSVKSDEHGSGYYWSDYCMSNDWLHFNKVLNMSLNNLRDMVSDHIHHPREHGVEYISSLYYYWPSVRGGKQQISWTCCKECI